MVVTSGGIILWSLGALKAEHKVLVGRIMRDVVIESTTMETSLVVGSLEAHWTVSHELGLLFLVKSTES